ncbi:unnamed protein product [Penicillium salamii]|nr:unnamed protein product [Penicillium salamii]CAG8284850.1 unnamed protein product [Penicillium salamii]
MTNKVLLTGGTGFIGSHILQQLLEQGYDVLAVVREEEKSRPICSQFGTKVEFAVVEDITKPGAFDGVFQNSDPIQYVIHSASPFIYGHSDAEREILQPAIEGSLQILKSVLRWAPSVKQVVLTSSLASMVGDPSANGVFNETHWNPINFEQSLDPENTYIGSKKLAEKCVWDFMSQHPDIHFSLTTINPALVFGPLMLPSQSGEKVNTSNQVLDELIQGLHADKVPEAQVPAWVDVRDVASAHVRAIENPAAQNQRFLISNELYTMDEIVRIMHNHFAILRSRLPVPQDSSKPPIRFDNSRSRDVLGIRYHSLEECIIATGKSLMAKNGL